MPPAIPLRQPRTLAHVLADLEDAHRDWIEADRQCQIAVGRKEEDESSDRMSEADNRVDAFRDEFATSFRAATGLSWKHIEEAIREAIL